jgi:hypothetical protein
MNGKSTRWALPPIWSAPLQFIYLHNASWMARTRRLSSSTGNRLDLAFSTGQGEGDGGMRGEGHTAVTPTGLGCARKGRMDCGQSLVCRNPGILVPFPDWPLRPALPPPPPATNSDPPRAAAATRASIFLRGASALSPGSRTARLCLASRPSHKDTGRQLRGRPGRRERWRWSGVEWSEM